MGRNIRPLSSKEPMLQDISWIKNYRDSVSIEKASRDRRLRIRRLRKCQSELAFPKWLPEAHSYSWL